MACLLNLLFGSAVQECIAAPIVLYIDILANCFCGSRHEDGELYGVEFGGSRLRFLHTRLPKNRHAVVSHSIFLSEFLSLLNAFLISLPYKAVLIMSLLP